MIERKYRDITVRGVTYPTVQDAARALGVTPNTVYAAMHNGTLDDCGLGKVHPKPMPVRIRGRVYDTARDAARELGVPRQSIYAALRRGTVDNVGFGVAPDHAPIPPRVFKIGGMSWPSRRAASLALGFERNYISRAYSRNSTYQKQRILAAAMRLRAEQDAMSGKGRDA